MTKNNYFRRFLIGEFKSQIQAIISALVVLILIQGCASSGGYGVAKFEDGMESPIKIYGIFDKEYTSKYFGSFRFVFENKRDSWLTIDKINLSFADDSAQKYINVLNEVELEQWGKAVRLQKNMNESTVKDLQSALLSAGSSISGMVGDIGESVGLNAGDQKRTYPRNHLYAEEFILPPGFAVEKWVLLESSHHERIPYITDINLELEVNKSPQQAKIHFRNKSSKYNNFNWLDPNRDVDLSFYMGASIGSVFPIGDFKETANRTQNLVNSFGINGYLAILNLFGINFSLDYQSFEARAKLAFRADTLMLPGTDFVFSSWENFLILVSPRFIYPATADIELFAELSAGFALCRPPTIISKRAGLEIAEFDGGNAFSLAGGAAFGSRFYLTDKLNLDIKLEYLPLLKPTFTYSPANNDEVSVTQKMSQFKIKASINWGL